MAHLSPIAVGLFPRRTGADETFVKQVGFADYYFGTRDGARSEDRENTGRDKLGLVQSLPVPGPLMTAKAAPKFMPRRLQQFLRHRMLPLAGIVEDLPDSANRVSLGPNGQPRLEHRFSPYDHERGHQLGRLMVRILRRAGALYSLVKAFPSDEHMAHQCGTLRFGADPTHAALGPDCRLFRTPQRLRRGWKLHADVARRRPGSDNRCQRLARGGHRDP